MRFLPAKHAVAAAAVATIASACIPVDDLEKVEAVNLAVDGDGRLMSENLGPGWELVAPGVFENKADSGEVRRVYVGPAGRAADLARLQSKMISLQAPPSHVDLRALESERAALQARINTLSSPPEAQATSTQSCAGDVYYTTLSASPGRPAGGSATSGRSYGFGPPIPWTAYAYAGVYQYGWPISANSQQVDNATAMASISTYPFAGCNVDASAWVTVPYCPNFYLADYISINCI